MELATCHTLLAYANQAVPPLAASTYDKKRVAGHGTQTTPSLTFACCVPHVAATSCRRLCMCVCVCIFGLCILYLVLYLSLFCCPFSVFFFNRVEAFFLTFSFFMRMALCVRGAHVCVKLSACLLGVSAPTPFSSIHSCCWGCCSCVCVCLCACFLISR